AEHAAAAGVVTAEPPEPAVRPALPRQALQEAMSRHAAVVRDESGLAELAGELDAAEPRKLNTRNDFEDAALTCVAAVVVAAARERTESRGCHHRSDYPETDPAQAVSVPRTLEGALVTEVACC
ncbi:MAG: L-aspartate oxidase, partial [Mycolicibacterium hassiacum]